MRFLSTLSAVLVLAFLALPSAVSAHERQVFDVGGTQYLFVVGSLNEPTFVDDKSGVELRVLLADPKAPGDSRASGVTPVEGLDKTLKVEVSAGAKKKVFDLRPAFGDPGAYKAEFFPTVATTFTYRVFGTLLETPTDETLAETPIDVMFACSPAGEATPGEDTSVVPLAVGVSRVLKAGSFGCPRPKGEAGFPEPALSLREVSAQPAAVTDLPSGGPGPVVQGAGTNTIAVTGLAAGLLSLVVGIGAWLKARRS